jgi:hypothetical protein
LLSRCRIRTHGTAAYYDRLTKTSQTVLSHTFSVKKEKHHSLACPVTGSAGSSYLKSMEMVLAKRNLNDPWRKAEKTSTVDEATGGWFLAWL